MGETDRELFRRLADKAHWVRSAVLEMAVIRLATLPAGPG